LSLSPAGHCIDSGQYQFIGSFLALGPSGFTNHRQVLNESSYILSHILEQVKVFNDNLEILRQRADKNAIHDLRVAVKKIRSFFRLAEANDPIEWKREFAPVKNLFKSLGRQRDFDVSLSILGSLKRKENLAFPIFRNFLQSNRHFTRQLSLSGLTQFEGYFPQDLRDKLITAFQGIPEKELEEKIKVLVDKQLKKMKRLKGNFDKEAHEVRKILKDVYYWVEVTPENSVLNGKQLKQLEKILDELGTWQDQVIFLDKLRRFRKKFLVRDYEEYDVSRAVEKVILKKKKNLQRSVRIKCEQFETMKSSKTHLSDKPEKEDPLPSE